MEFFLSASNGILGLPIQACILSHWHASMPTFPSKCRKESEKPTGSSRDKIDGKERGPLQGGAASARQYPRLPARPLRRPCQRSSIPSAGTFHFALTHGLRGRNAD